MTGTEENGLRQTTHVHDMGEQQQVCLIGICKNLQIVGYVKEPTNQSPRPSLLSYGKTRGWLSDGT